MRFNKNLATVHAYLCADGYVIRNPKTQNHKYYHTGFRNTNLILLKDFQEKFQNYFKIKPRLVEGERCIVQSKKTFQKLTENYSYYSYHWKMPGLSKLHSKFWLRAFFDCEAWVECQKGKSRTIRLECVNFNGIKSIQNALLRFNVESKIKTRLRKERTIYRMNICGLDDLKKFQTHIGFHHPNKKIKLDNAIYSYKS